MGAVLEARLPQSFQVEAPGPDEVLGTKPGECAGREQTLSLLSRISWLGDKCKFLSEESTVTAKIVVGTRCNENMVSFPSSFSFLREKNCTFRKLSCTFQYF